MTPRLIDRRNTFAAAEPQLEDNSIHRTGVHRRGFAIDESPTVVAVPARSRLIIRAKSFCLNRSRAGPDPSEHYTWVLASSSHVPYYREVVRYAAAHDVEQPAVQSLLWNLGSGTYFESYPPARRDMLLDIDPAVRQRLPSQARQQATAELKRLLFDVVPVLGAVDQQVRRLNGEFVRLSSLTAELEMQQSRYTLGQRQMPQVIAGTPLFAATQSHGHSGQTLSLYNPTNTSQQLDLTEYYLQPSRPDVQNIGMLPRREDAGREDQPLEPSTASGVTVITVPGLALGETLDGDWQEAMRWFFGDAEDTDYLYGPLTREAQTQRKSLRLMPFQWGRDPERDTREAINRLKLTIRLLLIESQHQGRALAVVAHSWGGVLSYQALRELEFESVVKIDQLTTLGTPLSSPGLTVPGEYVRGMSRRLGLKPVDRQPGNVKVWINFWAQGDYFSAAIPFATRNVQIDRIDWRSSKRCEEAVLPLSDHVNSTTAGSTPAIVGDEKLIRDTTEWHARYFESGGVSSPVSLWMAEVHVLATCLSDILPASPMRAVEESRTHE